VLESSHESKLIFFVAPLLPVSTPLPTLASQIPKSFRIRGFTSDLTRERQHTWLSPVFFAFVDFVHFARFGPDSDFAVMEPNESQKGKRFFPSGAIFFFVLLVLFYAALWLVIYWIMITRS
jgi:hypothetical protein